MELRALFVGADQVSLQPLQGALENLGVRAERAASARSALERLTRERFEAVVVDVDDLDGAQEIIPALRRGRSNKNAIVFAVLHGQTGTRSAFELGANFVLEKPIAAERAERSVRAAQGLLLRERRRYQRIRVHWSGEFRGAGLDTPISITISNVSEGGCALLLPKAFDLRGSGHIVFQIPSAPDAFEAKVEVTHCDPAQRYAGLKFLSISKKGKEALEEWMSGSFV